MPPTLRQALDLRRGRARLLAVAAAALTALLAGILAPAPPAGAASFTAISGAGSTWSQNAIETWIGDVASQGLVVNYNGDGSTSGRAQFKQGIVDWAASEIPYGVQDGTNFDAPPTRGYAYMPDTAGGLAFAYNLSIGGRRVTNLRLSGAAIAGIFTNKITQWNDPAIAADNPGLTLPATSITPVVNSDGSGATAQFTQWMLATQAPFWQSYCVAVGRSPCTQTSVYPTNQPGSAIIGVPRDGGVASYVAQSQANGAIGYTEYSYALLQRLPVAKVLNAAGYYTAPTAGNVGVSLLNAQVNMDQNSPLYLTADLSQVYTDPDPRTYELSYYSYMILPTDLALGTGLTTNKGFTLGAFGEFALCQGQQQVDALGYSALPVNLVEAGFAQLQKVPGSSVPTATSDILASCNNPTFSSDGTNTLATNDPVPAACDLQGTSQCDATTPGAVDTTTTVNASPSGPSAGQAVTLSASVVPATGATTPAGLVQFEIAGTATGLPVALDSNGVATTAVTFGTAGTEQVTAIFGPADITAFASSAGGISLTVSTGPPVLTMPLTMTLPAAGTLIVTVDSADTIAMTVSGNTATAAMNPVVVTDTRNTYPGWSVSGQAIDFTGTGTAAGRSFSGNQLGWTPTATSLADGVSLGATVEPAVPGLGTPADFASARAGSGYGTSTLSANLTLVIPPLTMAGTYTGSLTLSVVTALP